MSDFQRHVTAFGAAAAEYDRFRPAPPAQAVEWLLPERGRSSLDLGAGTGALTRLLLERVADVVAVEPDPRMRAVLAARCPRARVVGGTAENIPLADGTVDAVLVSAAWHLMDPGYAVPEVIRVLRADGWFGIVSNGPDWSVSWFADMIGFARGIPWVAGQEARSCGRQAGVPVGGGRADVREASDVAVPADPRLADIRTSVIRWSVPMSPRAVVLMLTTYAGVIGLPAARRAELVGRLLDFAGQHPALAGRPTVELPMICRCWRARRRRRD
jgi:SAM-dependent methyltransferase